MTDRAQDNQLYPEPSSTQSTLEADVKAGRLFYGGVITTIAAASTHEMLFRTGDKATTITLIEGTGRTGDMRIILYKDPTISADGAPVTPGNYNLRSPNSVAASLFNSPTVGAMGTEFIRFPIFGKVPGVTPQQSEISGGSGTFKKFFELPPNSEFVLCFDNFDADLAAEFGFSFDWRER